MWRTPAAADIGLAHRLHRECADWTRVCLARLVRSERSAGPGRSSPSPACPCSRRWCAPCRCRGARGCPGRCCRRRPPAQTSGAGRSMDLRPPRRRSGPRCRDRCRIAASPISASPEIFSSTRRYNGADGMRTSPHSATGLHGRRANNLRFVGAAPVRRRAAGGEISRPGWLATSAFEVGLFASRCLVAQHEAGEARDRRHRSADILGKRPPGPSLTLLSSSMNQACSSRTTSW